MRFKASIKNINVFIKIVASLGLLSKVAWIRLDNEFVRFTVIPEHGSQVWAVINIDSIFEDDFSIQSANDNTINLEVPLDSLHRALKSAQNATSASIRLTKKDNIPLLSLTITVPTPLTSSGRQTRNLDLNSGYHGSHSLHENPSRPSQNPSDNPISADSFAPGNGRETTVTQDVAIRVLMPSSVEGIHEPRTSEPEVHIMLPPLLQLKSISERFTKMALSTAAKSRTSGLQGGNLGPKLQLAANMHGELKMGISTDAFKIESKWEGLTNPELDPEHVLGGQEFIEQHPSTRMRGVQGEEAWATVRVDARDWGRVLGVGRVAGRVVACFCDEKALILYVYLPNEDPNGVESTLTYYISCYSS